MNIEALLERLDTLGDGSSVEVLRTVIDWLRPVREGTSAGVLGRIEELTLALEAHPDLRHRLCTNLAAGLAEARHLGAYTEIGLFSRRGFFKESLHRVYERLNPAPLNGEDLKDVFALVFHDANDPSWVRALPDDAWLRLFDAFSDAEVSAGQAAARQVSNELLYALEMLAVWVAAKELDPELQRLDPRIADRDSAFVALQRELALFVADYSRWLDSRGDADAFHDDAHAQVLLEQCSAQVERLRKRAVQRGSTIALTYLLERLDQTLQRIGTLLELLDPGQRERRRATATGLFKQLVKASADRYGIAALWQESVGLLSRSVTEHASRTGEHYVTRDRGEYLHMLRAAGGAGCIIAIMAFMKIKLVALGLSPGHETFWVCMFFGVLLGATGYVGLLTGLPLDIRHVAFSSANLGFVLPGHHLDGFSAGAYLLMVLLIGAVNLWVSFALALYVALSARAAKLGSLPRLLGLYVARIRARPAEVILPPRVAPPPTNGGSG
ncbi:MAG: hypothetical protein WD928_02370 [Gammaproteobacteria bacterium]